MKRYAVHHTVAAPASRTLGAVAFALALISVLAKRFELITPDLFVLSLAAAGGLAVLAIAGAIFAFVSIWNRGGTGTGASIVGTVFGLVALAAPAAVIGLLLTRPEPTDVSTDLQDPPLMLELGPAPNQAVLVWAASAVQESGLGLALGAGKPDGPAAELQTVLYPDIVPRRYRISPGELHAAARRAVDTLAWTVTDELPPDLLDAPTALWAQNTSRILGLKQDIAFRIRPDTVGALLDVRARSQSPLRELSGNTDVIRAAFGEVDKVLLETYGNLERVSVEENELEEAVPVEQFEPVRPAVPLPGFKPYVEDPDGLEPEAFELNELEG